MTHRLSTRDVRQHERLSYWIDTICSVYVQLDCEAPEPCRFSGSIARDVCGPLALTTVESTQQRVLRTPRQIARATEDFFLVSFQIEGRGLVRQDGRDALLVPGDFALYDSTRPYELLFQEPFRQLVLMLPGSELRTRLRHTEALTATAVSGREGAGHLMIRMIETLRADAGQLQPASTAAVAEGIISILTAGLQTLPAAARSAPTALRAWHLARIKSYVREHLADPRLSVAELSRSLQLSAAHIHRIFRDEPLPLAHYVRERRLEACRRDLLDPRCATRSVSDIAFSWGFNDAAHFSRAFRARYGVTPRDMRASGRCPAAATQAGEPDRQTTGFARSAALVNESA